MWSSGRSVGRMAACAARLDGSAPRGDDLKTLEDQSLAAVAAERVGAPGPERIQERRGIFALGQQDGLDLAEPLAGLSLEVVGGLADGPRRSHSAVTGEVRRPGVGPNPFPGSVKVVASS